MNVSGNNLLFSFIIKLFKLLTHDSVSASLTSLDNVTRDGDIQTTIRLQRCFIKPLNVTVLQ